MTDLEFTLHLKISLFKYNKDLGRSIVCLRPGQVQALKHLSQGMDCLVVLPTGYGKSLVYELLPYLYQQLNGKRCREIIFAPLNAILSQVFDKLGSSRSIRMKDGMSPEEGEKVKAGFYTYLIGHPEEVMCQDVLKVIQEISDEAHTFIVVDEAHCVLDWGEDFRPKFREIHELQSFLKNHNMFAMTATLTRRGQREICDYLHMKNAAIVNSTPVLNSNIKLNVLTRPASTGGQHTVEESYKGVYKRFLHELYYMGDDFPRTIVYCKLQWCGHAFEYGSMLLGYHFHRGTPDQSNARIAQYHSPQTAEVNEQVLTALSDKESPLRIVFATVALGMGADLRLVKRVVHAGPPNSIEDYTQEIGRAGRDGSPAEALLYYNNTDVAPNMKHLSDDMRDFVKNTTECRRKMVSNYFSATFEATFSKNDCCDICAEAVQGDGTVFVSLEQRHAVRQGLHAYCESDLSGQLGETLSSQLIEHIVETVEFLRSPGDIKKVFGLDICIAVAISSIIEAVIHQ